MDPTPDSRAEERNFALIQITANLAGIYATLEDIARSLDIQTKINLGLDPTYSDIAPYMPPRSEDEEEDL